MNQTTRKQLTVLESLYHLLSTDADLLTVTAAPTYDRLCAELGLALQEMGSEMVRQDAVDRHRELLNHAACRSFNMHEHAPLPEADRDRLWRVVQGMPEGELKSFSSKHFELGCWLRHYKDVIYPTQVFNRIDCLRRIVAHDIPPTEIGQFHAVFGFGQQQFDELLSPMYLQQVLHPLRAMARSHPTESYGTFFHRMGWQINVTAPPAAA